MKESDTLEFILIAFSAYARSNINRFKGYDHIGENDVSNKSNGCRR